MLVSQLWKRVVCAPTVRNDSGAGQHVLLDDGEQCGRVATRYGHQESFPVRGAHLQPPKHPLLGDRPADIVLPPAKQTLVDFDDDAWPADGDRVGEEVLRTNISAEVLPVDGGVAGERHLVVQRCERGVLVRPVVHQLHHLRQRQVTVLKERPTPYGQATTARPAASPHHAIVPVPVHQRLRATAPDASAMPVQKADLPTNVASSTCSMHVADINKGVC